MADTQHLPQGRRRAGDRHLNFHETRDILREALSEIAAYVPEARSWVTAGWELTEEKEPEQRGLIERRRAEAVKTERLFRSRKVWTPIT